MGTAVFAPVLAQSADDANGRLNQMEEQMRTLIGQVEQLTYNVKQLQGQLANTKQTGAVEQPAPMKPKKLAQQPLAASDSLDTNDQGVEQIGEAPIVTQDLATADTADQPVAARKAPGSKIMGTMSNTEAAAVPNDGGFQGQVLVPLGAEDGQTQVQDGSSANQDTQNSIETVAMAPETPETLYERSNESLLRRQFGEAETGFRGFLDKYPEHNLAGSAQYWLGETYYAQGDYRQAAQNFLSGYKAYPKSRRAPDSLLKLGMSLNKLGQTQQACASFGALSGQFPNAVDAKKRAQTEFKRAGC